MSAPILEREPEPATRSFTGRSWSSWTTGTRIILLIVRAAGSSV